MWCFGSVARGAVCAFALSGGFFKTLLGVKGQGMAVEELEHLPITRVLLGCDDLVDERTIARTGIWVVKQPILCEHATKTIVVPKGEHVVFHAEGGMNMLLKGVRLSVGAGASATVMANTVRFERAEDSHTKLFLLSGDLEFVVSEKDCAVTEGGESDHHQTVLLGLDGRVLSTIGSAVQFTQTSVSVAMVDGCDPPVRKDTLDESKSAASDMASSVEEDMDDSSTSRPVSYPIPRNSPWTTGRRNPPFGGKVNFDQHPWLEALLGPSRRMMRSGEELTWPSFLSPDGVTKLVLSVDGSMVFKRPAEGPEVMDMVNTHDDDGVPHVTDMLLAADRGEFWQVGRARAKKLDQMKGRRKTQSNAGASQERQAEMEREQMDDRRDWITEQKVSLTVTTRGAVETFVDGVKVLCEYGPRPTPAWKKILGPLARRKYSEDYELHVVADGFQVRLGEGVVWEKRV